MLDLVMLDLDGTLSYSKEPGGWVKRPCERFFFEETVDAMMLLGVFAREITVVTNQRVHHVFPDEVDDAGVTEMLISAAEMLSGYARKDVQVLACCHDKYEGCGCRKPAVGLLEYAMETAEVDAGLHGNIWMIGDKWSDIAAGKTAGVRTCHVSGFADFTASPYVLDRALAFGCPDIWAPDILSAVKSIIGWGMIA